MVIAENHQAYVDEHVTQGLSGPPQQNYGSNNSILSSSSFWISLSFLLFLVLYQIYQKIARASLPAVYKRS